MRRVVFGSAILLGLCEATIAFTTAAEAAGTAASGKSAAPGAPAAPAAAQPAMTTATFDDWVLGCQRAGPADKPVRVCEVGQIIRAPGQQDAMARVAIGRLNKGDPLHFTALLPPNASFPSTVHVVSGDSPAAALDLPWHRCVTGFCQADTDVRDETLKAWRAAPDPGRMTFQDATGHTVTVPLSLKGLGPALDALGKEGT